MLPRATLRRSTLLLALLVTLASGPLFAQDEDPLDSLFGDRTEKVETLPEDPVELVKALMNRGQYGRLRTVLRELRSKDPKSIDWLVAELELALVTGRGEAARPTLDAALKAEPLNTRLQEIAGRLHEAAGRLDEAEAAWRVVIKQDPNGIAGIRSRNRLGHLLIDRDRRKEARELWLGLLDHYQKQSRLSSDELLAIGQACTGLDLCPEVKKTFAKPMYKYVQLMFDQALKQDRRHVGTLVAYGEAYADKFNFPEARKVLKIALQTNRGLPRLRVALARALLGSWELGFRRYELARFHLREALSVHPNMPEALAELALLEISDNRYAEAHKLTDRALKVDPTNVRVRAVRAALAVFRGDEAALQAEQNALFKHRPKCARLLAQTAEIVGGRFRYKEARDLAARALEVDPGWVPALSTLGLNMTRTGEADEAMAVLERAQKADPFNVFVWNTLKVLHKLADKEVYEVHETKHFELKLPKDESASAPFILALLERAWRELGAKYEVFPKKVYVEFFSTVEDFSARSIGLPFIGALGVCFGNTMTILSAKENRLGKHAWGRTLWHEYTHVVTLLRTQNRVPRWFTEGLAVYEESRGMATWVREYDRALMTARRGGLILPVGEFDQGFSKPKFGGQVMLSYYQGGLISEFVEDRWGFDHVLAMLDGYRDGKPQAQIFREVFGLSEAQFDRGLQAYMDERYAGYPNSVLAPNPFAQMLQGVVLQRERRMLRDRLVANPWDLRTRARLALVYRALDKRADAMTLALDLKKRASTVLEAAAGKGLADLDSRDPAALARAGADLLSVRNALADAELVIAFSQLNRRDLERDQAKPLVVKGLKRALELGTSDPALAHRTLASLAMEDKDFKTAAEHFRAVARLVPPEAEVHRRLYLCYRKLKDEERATRELIQICLLDSGDLKSRLKAGELLYKLKRWDDLVRVLGDVAYINPFESRASTILAEAQRETGRFREALRTYQVALRTGAVETEKCHFGRALCFKALGRTKAALEAVRKTLAEDGSYPGARELLAELEARESRSSLGKSGESGKTGKTDEAPVKPAGRR